MLRGMTTNLTSEQQKRLEDAVAAGQFTSVDDSVRIAVDRLMLDEAEHGDRAWVRDRAREMISLEAFNVHVEEPIEAALTHG
jgi:Arc/MetJ-type ribon-helix-helix transcriptional regulator